MALLLRRKMVCIELVELVTDYLEGALPRSTRRRFESRLPNARAARNTYSKFEATIQVTGRVSLPPMSDAFRKLDFAMLYQRWMTS